MPAARTVLDRPTTPKGLLPTVSRRSLQARPMLAGRQLAASGLTGPALNFRGTNGWASVPGSWATGVSTDAATFEVWIRTTQQARQTLFIGSNQEGHTVIVMAAEADKTVGELGHAGCDQFTVDSTDGVTASVDRAL